MNLAIILLIALLIALLTDPKRNVTTIKVDLKLSTLKPIHAETVSKVYKYLKNDKASKSY